MKEKNAASAITVLRCIGVVIALGAIAVSDVGYGSNLENPRKLVNVQDAKGHLQNEMSALTSTVRDDKGVWFITQSGVENMYSLFEAMGYAVATDRLWQAETYRRSARGTLAEIFGPSYLETDTFMRTIGYSDQELQDGFDALDEEEKNIINGYVAGFNRRIGEVRQDNSLLPYEFDELGFSPEDWTVLDILAWCALLSRNFDSVGYNGMDQINNAVLYFELSEKFPAEYADMFDDLRWINDPEALTYIPAEDQAAFSERKQTNGTPIGDLPDIRAIADTVTARPDNVVKSLKRINAHVKMGSYAWSVGGEKTASGNPIIYSGPQMGFSVPSIVMEGSIRSDSLNISGMTVAGVPGIIIGRTPHHAWSMQVGEANTVDYYFESPEAVSLNREETIKVAGEEDVVVSIYRTAHGPVIQPMPYDPETYIPDPSNPIISWKYSHWGYEFEAIKAFLGFARATSMDEFGAAVEFLAVSQHFCYADCDGNIAYWMSGRDPVRPPGEWRFPQGFAAPALEWDAATLIPRSTDRNTSQGFYCGWNNKSNPNYDNPPNKSSSIYGPFHRAHVIHDYLAAHDNLTFEDIRDLALNIATTDSFNDGGNPWKFVSDDFSATVQGDPTPERMAALTLLGDWDGHFVDGGESCWLSCTNRSDAWILMDAWIREVIRLTFQDELDTATMSYADQYRPLLFNVLLHGLAGEQSGVVNTYDWFQNLSEPTAPQTADAIIVEALDNVLGNLGNRPWGTNARGEITYYHDMLGEVWTTPFAQRSTYAHCVEFGPSGPIRIESMFPLGESGDILADLGGLPVFDPNFFSMAPLFDTFTHREFPLEATKSSRACQFFQWVPSFGGTSAPELARAGMNYGNGRVMAQVKDASTDAQLSQVFFTLNFEPISLVVLPDFSGTSAPELAMLGRRASDGCNLADVRDASSGALLKRVYFHAEFLPYDLEWMPDFGQTSAPELVVLARRASDTAIMGAKRDASNRFMVNPRTWFAATFLPVDIEIMGDINANGVDELVSLQQRPTDDEITSEVRDASTNVLIQRVWFGTLHNPLDVEVVSDFGGGSIAPELAMLGQTLSSGAVEAVVRDSSADDLISTVAFSNSYSPVDIEMVSNFSGSSAPELVVLSYDPATDAVAGEVRDASTGTLIGTISFDSDYRPKGIEVLPSFGAGGTSAPELAVHGVNPSDGAVIGEVKDASSGALLQTCTFSKYFVIP